MFIRNIIGHEIISTLDKCQHIGYSLQETIDHISTDKYQTFLNLLDGSYGLDSIKVLIKGLIEQGVVSRYFNNESSIVRI